MSSLTSFSFSLTSAKCNDINIVRKIFIRWINPPNQHYIEIGNTTNSNAEILSPIVVKFGKVNQHRNHFVRRQFCKFVGIEI